MTYYAHSIEGEPPAKWQPLADHLRNVAKLASGFARDAIPHDENFAQVAFVAGLLHDLGKYRPEFQEMLNGRPKSERTRHKQAGAAKAADAKRLDLAFAIAGHHGGIPDFGDLKELVKGPGGRDVATAVWEIACKDCAEIAASLPPWTHGADPLGMDMLTRLVFSCLVDADWKDTTAFYRSADSQALDPEAPSLDASEALRRVLAYIAKRSKGCRDSKMATIRNEVLQASLRAAEMTPGLFTMTVPTGGAKTLSALAFAIAHAKRYGLRRVVYVAPYLSIIEQNAREIRRALDVNADSDIVFEHHSLAEPPGGVDTDEAAAQAAARQAEAWDAPVVITTNVQFFESLFANQPGRCRKLHNLARAVIILDECQTLPPGLVAPTCSMLGAFARCVASSIVLCTATQPAWSQRQELPEGLAGVREIAPPDMRLFERLRRVHVSWPAPDDAPLDWTHVAERMAAERAVLCVVNTKAAAREIFEALRRNGCDDAVHLSTAMCACHRLQVLDDVRRRLRDGVACQVVSTQLIEAGVDVDFPIVFRELAPLEAIIQAAGRANREGLLNLPDGSPGGQVIVFRSVAGALPPDRWYRAGACILEQDFLRAGRPPDIGDASHLTEYFNRLYNTGRLDENGLEVHRKNLHFAAVAKGYRVIDDLTVPVVVATWAPRRLEVATLLDSANRRPSRAAHRKLSPFQVNFRAHELDLMGSLVAEIGNGIKVWWGPYDERLGVCPDGAPECLVV